eukprot:TRINITY_DN66088_c0_g1_i2.p1 TRINITY_DN66088_c0_g1~~TRINITY_DN66088_c0_g1_i2.p1  ORF type:complete len:242 (-),score=26.31 TRINITY_DN66088_c0_g1_i2:89-814(-)
MLLESGGLQYLQDNSQQAACSIYPHMVLDIFGATSGRCEFSSMIITIQGKDENNYTEKMQQDFYQNTDRRNQQNQGFFLVIVEIIKKHKLPLNLAIHLLMKLTNKTYCLLMQNSFINGDYSREKRMAFNGGVKKLHNETKENLAVLSEIYVKNLLGDEQEKLKKDLDDILNTAFTKHFVTINPNVSLSSRQIITGAFYGVYTSRWKSGKSAALDKQELRDCLLYTSPSPRDLSTSRMPSSA